MPVRAAALGATLTLAVLAGVELFAALAAEPAVALLRAWQTGTAMGPRPAREIAYQRLNAAARLAPWNADYVTDRARFNVWHSALYPPASQHRRSYVERARNDYRDALALRPSWAFAWAQQALLWSRNPARSAEDLPGQADTDPLLALDRALVWGRYETDTQILAVDAALQAWPRVPEALRRRVRASVRRLYDEPAAREGIANVLMRRPPSLQPCDLDSDCWQAPKP